MEPNNPTTGSVNSSTELNPKSMIFKVESSFSFKKRQFSGFKSLGTILAL
jgi:hypothetical protein